MSGRQSCHDKTAPGAVIGTSNKARKPGTQPAPWRSLASLRVTAICTGAESGHGCANSWFVVRFLTYNEFKTVTTNTYDLANELTTALAGSTQTTFTFDNNDNNTVVNSGSPVSMSYDKENRLVTYLASGVSVTYNYSGDGLKRSEWNAGTPTRLVWDGQDYLQERP